MIDMIVPRICLQVVCKVVVARIVVFAFYVPEALMKVHLVVFGPAAALAVNTYGKLDMICVWGTVGL